MRSPSGEQLEIAFAGQRAVVTEVGAGLRTYSVDGREILDGYSDREIAPSGRGQMLLPWPNRIAEGRYEFGGEERQLPVNEPETGCAIHGLVRWAAWSVAEQDTHRVVVEHTLHPQPGYPFAVALSIAYSLSEDGLRVSTTATNVGEDPCPYGAGAHPYLNPGTPTVDTAILRVPARTVLDVGPVDGTEFDFRKGRPVGGTKLDHCFADLDRDDDGLVRVALDGTTLWADEAYGYLMLYTGDGRPDVARRSLAVEPMTCPPHAFRTGESVIVIEPGDSVESAWGLTPQ